jgi:translation initiation factor 1A
MPKNKGKGGKTRRKGKKNYEEVHNTRITYREDGQEYAYVIKMLGNGRLEAFCYNSNKNLNIVGKIRLCNIRGSMRKRVWIIPGDTILVGLRSFQDSRADVIHKYSTDDVHILKNRGYIPNDINYEELGIPVISKETDEFEFGNNEIDIDQI